MTAFAPGDLPPQIDSVEKLAVWALSILDDVSGNLEVVEQQGVNKRASDLTVFTAFTEETRFGFRGSLQINPNWKSNGLPLWNSVMLNYNTVIPASYKP